MKNYNQYYSGSVSDHFNGQRFFNPGILPSNKFPNFLKWRLTRKAEAWPKEIVNKFTDVPPRQVSNGELRVSWVGHLTFLLQTTKLNILTDPVWSERASPFNWAGPKRVCAPGIQLEHLPPIDIILITHNHYDHLDLKTLGDLWIRDKPKIIVPLGNDTIIKNYNRNIQVTARDWFESVKINKDIEIILDPAQHWSARGMNDTNRALWASFIIKTSSGNIYFAGDTGYAGGKYFRNSLAEHGSFRLALLPIGAFKPKWFMSYSHMDPEEAILAFKDLNMPYAVPSHHSTFPLADDGYEEALLTFFEHAKKHSIDLKVFKPLDIGEHWFVPRI
ncbi:MBL fold metallo-hydrolase [Candidatus Trichorickettsia mobilis]|uniref:MBL fold metallo-hydrolase n=1 Tax=Candidatus Trichorickettsia mobilis TaxID=1346319 RepID=UPI00292D4858|nr:MBL fold metallo-hydrolase [Candidatus Trichorickettsia mobilis]